MVNSEESAEIFSARDVSVGCSSWGLDVGAGSECSGDFKS